MYYKAKNRKRVIYLTASGLNTVFLTLYLSSVGDLYSSLYSKYINIQNTFSKIHKPKAPTTLTTLMGVFTCSLFVSSNTTISGE